MLQRALRPSKRCTSVNDTIFSKLNMAVLSNDGPSAADGSLQPANEHKEQKQAEKSASERAVSAKLLSRLLLDVIHRCSRRTTEHF